MSTNLVSNKASDSSQASARPEAIWYTRCPVPTAAGIAIQKGWLKDEFAADGIDFRSIRHSQDPKTREAHYTHTLDDSFRQGGNAPALYARSEGKDTVLLGLHWIPQYQAILSLPESGITTIRQLRGRKLALPRRVNDAIDFWRATALQGYENALRLEGLSLDDVELVDLPIERSYVDEDVAITDALTPAPRSIKFQTREMVALLRREVDAMFGYSVWGAAVRSQLSATEIVNLATLPSIDMQVNNGAPETLTVSGGLLREHPDLVERYLAKLLMAADWAKTNKDAARRAIAIETGSAEYWLDQGCGADCHSRLQFSFDKDLLQALEMRKQFLLEHGFIRENFSIVEWADDRPLENALKFLRCGS
ncbi:MAG: ABC transporter substrate-binding protein [Pseudorhodoplanes sp.]|uniref:ABC transporter substrate-binding protein n=1 Tax=Pseudorhodoplanes sp. TaxID=1934341 RepID=UPI003D0CB9F1